MERRLKANEGKRNEGNNYYYVNRSLRKSSSYSQANSSSGLICWVGLPATWISSNLAMPTADSSVIVCNAFDRLILRELAITPILTAPFLATNTSI